MKNGARKIENGARKMENRAGKMENGAGKMENGAGKMGRAGKLNVQILCHKYETSERVHQGSDEEMVIKGRLDNPR